MTTPAVAIRDLVKIYRGSRSPAVDGLGLEIGAGEIQGFLGPNGAGKTTTMSIVCGLLAPTRGAVEVFGHDVVRHPGGIRPLLGFVPQEIALYGLFSARENLAYFGRMHGLGGRLLDARVDEALAMVGLEGVADRRVETYSGGMKRRANLAAGLLGNPRLLVLDEPTVGVDVQSRTLIFDNLRALNRAGTTILYATHDMEGAGQLCTRVAVIDQGRVIAEGKPADLVASRPGCADLESLFLELTGRHLRD
jgi:ABC-2 type transport system ATP-binding protein